MTVYEDDERYALQRGRYLSKAHDLRLVEGKAIAYLERGYSASGAAAEMDTTTGTVKSYLSLAQALFGMEVGLTKVLPGEEPPEYEVVTDPEYGLGLPYSERETWRSAVNANRSRLPDEWVGPPPEDER